MRGMNTIALLVLLPAVLAKPHVMYAGFEHILTFEEQSLKPTAFDFRRHIPVTSTCDMVAFPPLVADSELLEDWISKAHRENPATTDLTFTYLGYENFIMENKLTGDYVIRRCRDFRPQLTTLPCEPFATGNSAMLKHPYKTVHMGNNRVMVLNTETGDYATHPFDADVHSGGDPFRFDSGAFFSGHIEWQNLGNSSFAYVQLKNNEGDLLVVMDHTAAEVTAYKFHGLAKSAEEVNFERVLVDHIPGSWGMIPLGETDLLFSSPSGEFERWRVARVNHTLRAFKGNHGNFVNGVECRTDNATLCATSPGCAWCSSSYSCQPYDVVSGIFCDKGACSVPPMTNPFLASKSVVVPDCVKDPDVQYNDIMEQIDDGYKLLPGHIRLSSEYRNDIGDHSHQEAAPIHPDIDNQLGEDPVIIDEEFQDEVIHENNRVGANNVYTPPPASESAPCMDTGYTASKGADVSISRVAESRMNVEPLDNEVPLAIPGLSPRGEDVRARDPGCGRQNATQAALAPDTDFVPAAGGAPPTSPDFEPQSVTTRFEEDLMNSESSKYADLKANWVDEAEPTDPTLTRPKIDGSTLYQPREFAPAATEPVAPAPKLRVAESHPRDLMNEGLKVETPLAGVDCTDTGGDDGFASATQHSAMQNSKRAEFPDSLESQLRVSETHNHGGSMDFTAVETNRHIKLPFADTQNLTGDAAPQLGQA